jgi:YggT family protein
MDRERQISHEESTKRQRKGRERPDRRDGERVTERRTHETAVAEPREAPPTRPPGARPSDTAPQPAPGRDELPSRTEVTVEERHVERPRRDTIIVEGRPVVNRVVMAVDYIFLLLYGLLGIRFLLSLLGASEAAGFVRGIQSVTAPFYAPFHNIVGRAQVDGGFIDYPILIALLAYGLLHAAVRGLVRVIGGRQTV